MSDYSPISVIMPIYNEVDFIDHSVGAMQQQDYPGQIEILCCDGMSTDGTRDRIQKIAALDPRVKLLDNPKRITPAALNVGIQAAQHGLIARMDGHALAARDYLSQCYHVMEATGSACVGGRLQYNCTSFKQCAIAAAMESRFAVGTAVWRGETAGKADTVPYGLYTKALLEQIGGFDEDALVNQDYELMVRIKKAGFQIYFSPDIQSEYFPRQSFRALLRQYYRYGFWKVRTIMLHPASVKPRHLLAPAFVAGLVIGLALSIISVFLSGVYLSVLALYTALSCLFALIQAKKWGWRYLPLIPWIFLLLHVAWGAGFWVGIWRWGLRWKHIRSVT